MNLRRGVEFFVVGLLVALPFGSEILFNSYYLDLVSRIVIVWVALLGYDILAGYSGLVSFGHAVFFGAGAYGAAWTLIYCGPMPWLAVPAGTLLAVLAAVLVGAISIRTKGIYFILLTLIFAQFGYELAFNGGALTGGQNGLSGLPTSVAMPGIGTIDLSDSWFGYYLVIAVFVVAYVAARWIVGSEFGAVLAALRENEDRTSYLGYDVSAVKRRVFAISGAFAGLGGALWALHQAYVSPELLHWTLSGQFLIMTWIGGVGTLIGPLIGGAVLTFFADFLSSIMKNWLIIFGVLYILIVLYAPQGLWGIVLGVGRARAK